MQDVIEHTTLNNVKTEITTVESLRNHIEENQFAEIQNAITTIQDSRKRTMQQIKNKKSTR